MHLVSDNFRLHHIPLLERVLYKWKKKKKEKLNNKHIALQQKKNPQYILEMNCSQYTDCPKTANQTFGINNFQNHQSI